MNAYTPDPRLTEARRIADIAEREYERLAKANLNVTPWVRNGLLDLQAIKWAALAVQDYLAGHDGFEDAPAELQALLSDWADNVDYRTFPATPALDAMDLGEVWNLLAREGRKAIEGDLR